MASAVRRSRLWWRRWRSGAYDRVPVIRAALVEKLRRYTADPGGADYFGPDLAALESAGRVETPARSTLDAFFAVAQDHRLSDRNILRCLRALGLSESPLLDAYWRTGESGGGVDRESLT